jgi:hypothetical protein
MSSYIPATYNNVRELEEAGAVGLVAYSLETGETDALSTDILRLFKIVPDVPLCDSQGYAMVIGMSSTDVLVNEIHNIVEDYVAFDRLQRRGYFGN